MVLLVTVQPYTLKSGAQVYVIIVVVVLRFFEYAYIVEVLGLWGMEIVWKSWWHKQRFIEALLDMSYFDMVWKILRMASWRGLWTVKDHSSHGSLVVSNKLAVVVRTFIQECHIPLQDTRILSTKSREADENKHHPNYVPGEHTLILSR